MNSPLFEITHRVAVCFALALGATAPARGQDPPPQAPAPPLRPEQVLYKQISVDFENMPLREVVRALAEQQRVNIVFEATAIEEAGVATDSPVSQSLDDVRMVTVLKLILDPFDLAYTVEDNVIVISTTDNIAGREQSIEQRIWERLRTISQVNFRETPLSDVAESLDEREGVRFRLDTAALIEAGVAADTPITFTVSGIPLGAALRLMLRPLDLTYVLHDDVVLITTVDEAQGLVEARVYDVTDLLVVDPVSRRPDYDSLIQMISSVIAPDTWPEGNRGAISVLPPGSLVVLQTESAHDALEQLLRNLRALQERRDLVRDASNCFATIISPIPMADSDGLTARTYPLGAVNDEFIEVIRQTIAPDTWVENGGKGTIRRIGGLRFADGAALDGALVVRQTPAVHQQLQKFLDELQGIAQSTRPQRSDGGGGGFGGGHQGKGLFRIPDARGRQTIWRSTTNSNQ